MLSGIAIGIVVGVVLTLILVTIAAREAVTQWLCRRKGHDWDYTPDGEMFCRRCLAAGTMCACDIRWRDALKESA